MSDHLTVGSSVTDMLTNAQLPDVGEGHTLHLNLQPHQDCHFCCLRQEGVTHRQRLRTYDALTAEMRNLDLVPKPLRFPAVLGERPMTSELTTLAHAAR